VPTTKLIISFIFAAVSLATQAEEVTKSIGHYIETARFKYAASLEGAYNLSKTVEQFLANPTTNSLNRARSAWIAARKPYSETEVYRFYGGPIDDEDGPEGSLNAWPLDESYIESIIADSKRYPEITPENLRAWNELDGEKNIATGYHAIEFLLWGQDNDPNGPGNRPASDYVRGAHADRRAEFLRAATALLVADLEGVVVDWGAETKFIKDFQDDKKRALTRMFTGVIQLAGFELSQERMFAALDTMEQEEEQSCFSDTTHVDFIHGVKGISNVLQGPFGLMALIAYKNSDLATEIDRNLKKAMQAVAAIPPPFDRAIINNQHEVMTAIEALEALAESLKKGALELGIEPL
jgi:putative iron-regulated protein